MVKRAPTWQETMRMNLELKLISASPTTRVRAIPMLFSSEMSAARWLQRLEEVAQDPLHNKSRRRRAH